MIFKALASVAIIALVLNAYTQYQFNQNQLTINANLMGANCWQHKINDKFQHSHIADNEDCEQIRQTR